MTLEEFLNERQAKWIYEESRKTRRNITQREFAKWLGLMPTTYSPYKNGSRIPGPEILEKLAAKLGPEVYDAAGIPRPMPADPLLREIAEGWDGLDEEAKNELMKIYRALDEKNRGQSPDEPTNHLSPVLA